MNWQDGMKGALIAYVLRNGALVKESASQTSSGRQDYGGWQEYGWDEGLQEDVPALTVHMRDCRVNLTRSSYEDTDWCEFSGTFAEPPWEHRAGTDVVVYCACGKVCGRRWRYTGGLANLIRAITETGSGQPHQPEHLA
jgi:hypothetical protein